MKHYPLNPRQISKAQFKRLQETMHEFGDLSGIVHNLEDDTIIGGNQRSEAAALLEQEPTITERFDPPTEDGTVSVGYFDFDGRRFTYRAVRWDSDKAQRANLIANVAGGSWDWDVLSSFESVLLSEVGFDNDLLKNFQADSRALSEFIQSQEMQDGEADAEPQFDRAEELLEKWGVQTGDLWQIGAHRLLCGDSTRREDVERVMRGEKADLLLINPPYGDLKIFSKDHTVGKSNAAKVQNYGEHFQGEGDFDLAPVLEVVKPYVEQMVIWGGNYFTHLLPPRTGWLVWDKRAGEHSWFSDCELAWTNLPIVAKMFTYTWQGMIRAGEKEERYHPTQKPVPLMDWVLAKLTPEAHTVMDLFNGSGVIMLACENQKRICRSVELDPAYCAVTLQRMQDAFGLVGVRMK